MKRFYRGKKVHPLRRLWFSVILFLVVAFVFYFGVASVSAKADSEQKKSLEEALWRSATHCYATQGQYPESLEALRKEYGIEYDTDKYFVDYQILGANIVPDITVIEK